METSPMETDDSVEGNRIEPQVEKLDEIAPAEVCETRAQTPEIEKSLDQHVNMVDVTKLSYEVQQGYRVFMEMSADSYKNVTWPFLEPVDAEALGLWDYHEKIKEPMSFHEIGCKFNKYEYTSITEVIADIRLILENCYRYNGANHWVSKLGNKMEKILDQKIALLNRSLRDKVSLEATMALKSDFITAAVTGEGTGRRRNASRNSYIKMINGEDSSSLLTRLKIQEDIEERERRRIREKEKREANLVLFQDLAEWEEKELGADVVKQLHSMWEIPSLASLLFLLKDFLYIQDLSVTELELGFVYANKSSLLARIFTALLVTPHQRKSLFKKPPMNFKVLESKLCDRMNIWYKAAEKDGQELICQQYGLDMTLFEVLGEVNPLVEKSYMDLTLHQRVWILKCICDNSLVRDFDFREHLATIAATDQRELRLGNDADNWSYMYFPIFSATDLRIYKQCPLENPMLSKRKKKVTPPLPPAVVKAKVTPARPATPTQSRRNPRLRKLRNTTPSPEPDTITPPTPTSVGNEDPPEPKSTIAEGFELVAFDVDTLKKLCEKFEEPPPPPKKRGRKPKPLPPRKRCEVDLHQTLLTLLDELEKYEVSFSKLLSKAKIKIMKESQEPEPEDEPEEVVPAEEGEEWGSEESIGDEIEDAGAKDMSSDEDFVLEDAEGRTSKTPTLVETKKNSEHGEIEGNGTPVVLPQKRKAEETNAAEDTKQLAASDPCSISIQTAPLKLKKKRKQTLPIPDVKPTSVSASQATTGVPQVSLISHVPAGLQKTNEVRVSSAAATSITASCVNTVAVANSCNKTLASGRITVVGSQPSSSITQANASSVRVHPKLPVILSKSNLSTVVKSSSPLHTSCSQSKTSANVSTASKNLSSMPITVTSPSLHSQAHLVTKVPVGGKVMLVKSSGVPLQVLPVSQQSLVDGKSVSLGDTISSTPLQVVSSLSQNSTLQVLKAMPILQQSLIQGKTLKTAPVEINSNSTPLTTVSSSPSPSTPAQVSVLSQVFKATPVSQQSLVQGKTLSTALPKSSSASSPVNFVSSSSSPSNGTGVSVPIHVVKTVPILQLPLAQGKSLNAATSGSSSGSSPVHLVSSASSPSTPTGAVFTSSKVTTKATTHGSQMPSSPIRKLVISGVPTDVASVLSTVKQTTQTATSTSATSLNPPVILVQPTGTGGVIPLTVKGGAVVMPTPSASQQVVIMPPPNVQASSTTTSTAGMVKGTSIPHLGNKQTSVAQKVVLSPITNATGQSMPQLKLKVASVSSNKPFVQVAMSAMEMKPSETITSTAPLESKPVVIRTAAVLPTTKAEHAAVSLDSNSTELVTTRTNANSTCETSSAVSEQVANHICISEVSQSSSKTVTSLAGATTVVADTCRQIVSALSGETNLKQNNVTKCDVGISSQTIPLDKSCESEKLTENEIENKYSAGLKERDDDAKSSSELSLDLTCYETSVSDSAGCEDSEDSAQNGLHLSNKKSPPWIVTGPDIRLCNGNACQDTQTNQIEEKTFGSKEENHATVANQT